ncbi:uncharacterized protein LOC113147262 [Cyclospora cayetanensis]|uniref:Uncharacterized protein LOC113147262 n=1 Tax=Cyclospora cayetanensis TaxID=88456 RepID=A0A6P6RYJ7_9EIME|nr:uncharacterized protein LOC113147262 [Cyclospora cayetanensis]
MNYALLFACWFAAAGVARCISIASDGKVHNSVHLSTNFNNPPFRRFPAKPAGPPCFRPRFLSASLGSSTKPLSPEPREVSSQEAGNTEEHNSWIDPLPPDYQYPIEDYLVIPNTRRFCEGSNILKATAADSNFGSEEDTPNRVRQPKAVFCRGIPDLWEQRNGVVTVMRKDLSAAILKPMKRRNVRAEKGSGSITQDALFDSRPKGALVIATLTELK